MAAVRDKAKKFHRFVKGLATKYPQVLCEPGTPLLDRFIFYLLFYSNPVANAKKAYKTFTDEKRFASWSEVRVATRREIAEILADAKVQPSDFLAPRLKEFLQELFQQVDDTGFDLLQSRLTDSDNAKERKSLSENTRVWVTELPGIPPWGSSYLLTGLGLDNQMPWDPHTEAVLEEQKAFPGKATLNQKKRVAKALLDGLDMDPLDAHHLLVEYAKRDLKRR